MSEANRVLYKVHSWDWGLGQPPIPKNELCIRRSTCLSDKGPEHAASQGMGLGVWDAPVDGE